MRREKQKKKSYSENWENWETAAIIWLIKDCMPKIANATGHRAIGWWRGCFGRRGGVKVKSDTV